MKESTREKKTRKRHIKILGLNPKTQNKITNEKFSLIKKLVSLC